MSGMVGRTLSPLSVVLFLLFSLVAYAGTNIVAFERSKDRLSSLTAAPSIGAAERSEAEFANLYKWKDTLGLATRARSAALDFVLAKTPEDRDAVEQTLREVAEASPTSVASWQALLAFRKAIGSPMESVLTALRMSALTGSHEAYFMVQRAIFGLENWSELPDADRQIVLRDLLKTVLVPELGRGQRYRAIIAKKSEAERE